MPRIAFDLDETLGVPLIAGAAVVGFQVRAGGLDLLARLRPRCTLCLWSVSSRRYLDKVLASGLAGWFAETYSWDELPGAWKDVGRIGADLLVDDSPHHRETAAQRGLADRYLVVPAYGSPEDEADPLAWARSVEGAVERLCGAGGTGRGRT
jgi:hypothetical protein